MGEKQGGKPMKGVDEPQHAARFQTKVEDCVGGKQGKRKYRRREDNRHRKWAWSKRRRDGDGESGSPVHRPLSPVTVSGGERREESRAAARHPQSNSIQGSPASACLPPTLHPITADTFPPTTLLLTASTYYFTHSHAHTHCERLCVHHTQADV